MATVLALKRGLRVHPHAIVRNGLQPTYGVLLQDSGVVRNYILVGNQVQVPKEVTSTQLYMGHGKFSRTLSSAVDYTIVNMPALSPTMESGRISKWFKNAGDTLSAGDVICDVETDKATVAFDMQDDGILAKILAKEGSGEVSVGEPVAVVVEDREAFTAFSNADAAGAIVVSGVGSGGDSASAPIPEGASIASSQVVDPQRTVTPEFLFAPAARHMAESRGLDASSLQGTGKNGRITKGDLMKALGEGVVFPPLHKGLATSAPEPDIASPVADTPTSVLAPAVPAPAAAHVLSESYTDVPANNIRKVVAKRLTDSKSTVPHLYVSMACEMDGLMAFRKRLAKDHGVKVSVNDIIIRSAALALRDVPEANASWVGGAVRPGSSIDISVAVATPTGLITPIVTDADKRGLSSISDKVRDLATRAKDNKLKPEEFMGGSFTVSNLGMFGINEFSAVINIPQACILAVGGGAPTVKPGIGDGAPPRVCSEMTARLSCDRRVVDESVAGQLLQAFKHYVQTPELLLL